jgi:hypothetical protein
LPLVELELPVAAAKVCCASVSSHCTEIVAVVTLAPVEGSVAEFVLTVPVPHGPRAERRLVCHIANSYCANVVPEQSDDAAVHGDDEPLAFATSVPEYPPAVAVDRLARIESRIEYASAVAWSRR